ncbi:MAG: aerotolerance regulator BatA, partial [Bacteroidaceae bacterium]|nr:aerotolerance regulator BatA [Bacteroidaceae bacterium]
MVFAKIGYLLLFIPLIGYVLWYILRGCRMIPALKVSTTLPYGNNIKNYKNYLIHVPFILRVIVFSMIIFVLARPQSTNRWQNTEIE